MRRWIGCIGVAGMVAATGAAYSLAAAQSSQPQADVVVASAPENLVWGWYPIDAAPIATVRQGQVVRIESISQRGATQDESPQEHFGALGATASEILPDVTAFWQTRAGRPREGRAGHVLTGPVYIEGAEAGDMLEVQILDLRVRVPYGINSTGPNSGVFQKTYPGWREGDPPSDVPESRNHLIRTGKVGDREYALFSPKIRVPLAPFLGIMAVAPNSPAVGEPGVLVAGVQNTTPPGIYGGNLDMKDLVAGTTLFLPVFHSGARFYVGDPHGVQGDGEVSGNALEQSVTGTFRFRVHKGRPLTMPRAETPTHYILMGIDKDLNRAMKQSTDQVIKFLVAERGLTPAQAFSLASIAVDFHVAEAVDLTQVVSGQIPKSIFID